MSSKFALTVENIKTSTENEIIEKLKQIDEYVNCLEDNIKQLNADKSVDAKVLKIQAENAKRENSLILKLTVKEQELQDALSLIEKLKSFKFDENKNKFMDPSINFLLNRLKDEITVLKNTNNQLQDDLNSFKFTPNSITGKKLITKCRLLVKENDELGSICHQGATTSKQIELSIAKSLNSQYFEYIEELEDVIHKQEAELDIYKTILFNEANKNNDIMSNLRLVIDNIKKTDNDKNLENEKGISNNQNKTSSLNPTDKKRKSKEQDEHKSSPRKKTKKT